eukprot:gb/GECG01010418.1/.p1 GENE.gb/GECG01010418.1/~~gb/GECG01010418.1/.p1  ORF type:complete len:661 (+),score=87.53 gb/GECG01010418.1/:1-1983(+)
MASTTNKRSQPEKVEEEEDYEEDKPHRHHKKKQAVSRECPYLDTIQRQRLDFDFEKQCSVTLATQHVYVCLVCGQIFQGRGPQTPAYTHAVQNYHHVFMNLHTTRIYCLPDGYEVIDSSLRDIQNALDPQFTHEEIENADFNTALSRDIMGVQYLPGFIGLNNLKRTDYVNVTVHALAHVLPLRDYFLQPSNYKDCTSILVHKFGQLMRKIWSPGNFKSTVSPHELVQTIVEESEKKFTIETQCDVMDFATWFLNQLHLGLVHKYPRVGDKKIKPPPLPTGGGSSSIIHEVFQGEVEVFIRRRRMMISVEQEMEEQKTGTVKQSQQQASENGEPQIETFTERMPALFLSLDLPPAPLYRDENGRNIIPQISLYKLLEKYDGEYVTDVVRGDFRERRQYRITRLPPYLLMNVKRFTNNAWFTEKNPHIVNLPAKNLEMSNYMHPDALDYDKDNLRSRVIQSDSTVKAGQGAKKTQRPPRKNWQHVPPPEMLPHLTVQQLKQFVKAAYRDGESVARKCLEKDDLVRALRPVSHRIWCTKYDLVANVSHDSPPEQSGTDAAAGAAALVAGGARGKPRAGVVKQQLDPLARGSWRVHVYNDALNQWYEIDDLHVSETQAQMIGLSESYLMVYRSQAWDPRKKGHLENMEESISTGLAFNKKESS